MLTEWVLYRLVLIEEEDGLVHYKYRDLEAGSVVEGKYHPISVQINSL